MKRKATLSFLFSFLQFFMFSQTTQHTGFSIDPEIGYFDIGIGSSYAVNNSIFFSLNGIITSGYVTDDVIDYKWALMANLGIGNKYDSFAGSIGFIYFINRYYEFGIPITAYYRNIFLRFIPYLSKNFGGNLPTGYVQPKTPSSFDFCINIGYSIFLGKK